MSEIPNKRRKTIRQKRQSDDSDDGIDSSLLDDIVEWQKSRKRPVGLKVEELNKVKDDSDETKVKEEKKESVGGYVDPKALKKEMENENIHQITSFAVETNKRDEDEPLKRYVEERMAQIKGANKSDDSINQKSKKADVLFELPESIKELAPKRKTEETLSDQMLSGIPEVDLGIEVKIRNIEATEEAKMKLLKERLNKKDRGPEFVPSNVAVNFAQHHRFNIDESNLSSRKPQPIQKPTPIITPESIPNTSIATSRTSQEKATDDFHYEKFKRHMRRF